MKKAILVMLAVVLGLLLCACAANQPGDSGCTHEWQAATCTTPKTCTKCNETNGVALGHIWKAATCTNPITCTRCNMTEGALLSHTWKDATCTDPQTCSKCNTTKGSATGHSWKSATCTTPQTCTKCNKTSGSATGHYWSPATCLAPKTCSICKIQEGTKGNHDYKSATCTTPKECKHCGVTSGNALGCTAGSNGKCIRCGKSMVDIADVLSAPMDTLAEINRFVSVYYTGDCYSAGNFRLIFNSANGVILSWGATNTSNKEIKYITFKITYYNRVGDLAYDSLTGKSSYTAQLVGPIGAGKSFYFRGLIGYGSDIYYGVISEMKIEYMDGTSVSGNYGYTTWHNIRTGASPKECFVIEK